MWPEFAAWLSGVVAEEQAEGRGEGGVVFVAHNAQFDHKFLKEELSRCGFSRCGRLFGGCWAMLVGLKVILYGVVYGGWCGQAGSQQSNIVVFFFFFADHDRCLFALGRISSSAVYFRVWRSPCLNET